jgi:hypothetical protein
MFVQIIEGAVSDPDHLRRQWQQWRDELRPGAIGFLGSTAGIAPDGSAFLIARFESEDAARANAARPEQDAWFAETEKCFEGDPTFVESTDVEVMLGGGSDDAGFVQVMKGTASDRGEVAELDRLFADHAAEWRPDVLGGIRAWATPTRYVEVFYFTSEAEARTNEQKPPPPELAERTAQGGETFEGVTYLDLADPMLTS